MLNDSDSPITVVVGKGGVGKTTVAAAYALGLADAGFRTLLLSTDPAHSLGDVLDADLGDRPAEVQPGLWVREPDADAMVRRRIRQVARDAEQVVPAQTMPAVHRHLEQAAAAPGMVESAMVDLLVDAMAAVPDEWDRLVVDSAPTGHLLRLLRLPTLLEPWVQGLARQRERAVRAERFATALVAPAERDRDDEDGQESDPLLQRLHARRRRMEQAGQRLRTDCTARLVLLPQRMVVAETERAAAELTDAGIELGPAVINQVPASVDPEGLEAARRCVARQGRCEIPRLDAEPIGVDALRTLLSRVY